MTGSEERSTHGSLFAGIGGFDLGFERAGWRTVWQVEANPIKRACLADRFPTADRFGDVQACGRENLSRVHCITAGFPCTDISIMRGNCRGGRQGLAGSRSGLFSEVVRILREIRPQWVVLENVPSLLSINDCRDMETVIRTLADCGYVGFFRVLDAQGFGVPQKRRRLFVVAGLGRQPPLEFLADAAPVEALPCASFSERIARAEDRWAGNTLTAGQSPSIIGLGCEVLVAEADGWNPMVERSRSAALHGVPTGLDARNWVQRNAAGDAVVPAIAQWIAELLGGAG